ncbi:MAG: hypothetical protein J6S14_15780 [Clostridia bacterium]|nr:hypothetical protein [Clostridia bacterium]
MQGYIKYAARGISVKFYGINIPTKETGCFYGFCKKYPFISTGYKNPVTGTVQIFKLIDGKWTKFEEDSSFSHDLNREFIRIINAKNAAAERCRKKDPETYREYTRMSEVHKASNSITF